MASAADRLEMCRLAIQGSADLQVDDSDIRNGAPIHDLHCPPELKTEGLTRLHWLIGVDMFIFLPQWRQNRWQ